MDKRDELKKLQQEWYKRLEDEGFEDIEQDEEHLKVWHGHSFSNKFSPDLFEAKTEYYQAAGRFLHEYAFSDETEKTIWEQHANGISIRNIVKTLTKQGVKTYKRKVDETVQRLRKEMKTSWKR